MIRRGGELLSVVSSTEASCLVLAADTLTTGTEITVSVDGTRIGSAAAAAGALTAAVIHRRRKKRRAAGKTILR